MQITQCLGLEKKQVSYNKTSETANNSDAIKKVLHANMGESCWQQRNISIYSQQCLYYSKGTQMHPVSASLQQGL